MDKILHAVTTGAITVKILKRISVIQKKYRNEGVYFDYQQVFNICVIEELAELQMKIEKMKNEAYYQTKASVCLLVTWTAMLAGWILLNYTIVSLSLFGLAIIGCIVAIRYVYLYQKSLK